MAMINVAQATPKITWTNPSAIMAGTALGAALLDAMASVPGRFTYTPAVGTVLAAGASQQLTVTFTPPTRQITPSPPARRPSTSWPCPRRPMSPGSSDEPNQEGTDRDHHRLRRSDGQRIGKDRALYNVFGAVKKHKKTVYTKGVGIKGITIDGNTHVTINFAKPYKGAVKLTVLRGILAADGALSSGEFSAIVDDSRLS